MIKFTAMIFIVLGFAFCGNCVAAYHSKRISILNDIILMLTVCETQLRYTCVPVNELLHTLNENTRLKSLGFISSCKVKTDAGEAFPFAWKESIQNEKELCFIIHDVQPYLVQFGEELGSTDLEGQMSCCEYYKQIFSKELTEREEQNKKYSKLFPMLGLMLGLSAAIIII